MFLGVSGTLADVDITEKDRKRIGQVVAIRRRAKFGTKSAAYRQAGLNAATWDRIEAGDSVREDRLVAALKLLWPESGGDWHKAVDEMDSQIARLVQARYPVFGGSWEDPDYLGHVEEWIEELQGRIEVLEAAVFKEEVDDVQRNTAPNDQAGGSPAHNMPTKRQGGRVSKSVRRTPAKGPATAGRSRDDRGLDQP